MVRVDPPSGPNDRKFRELVVLIARKSEGDKQFGATKLNKLLFYADFLSYLNFGRSITKHVYQRLRNGPAPRRLLPILDEMETAGDIVRADRQYYGKTQKVVLAKREPDTSCFTSRELSLINDVIQDFWNMNATQMSEKSHQFRGWQLAEDKEEIPYQMALVQFVKPTKKDRARFEERADELSRLAKDCLGE